MFRMAGSYGAESSTPLSPGTWTGIALVGALIVYFHILPFKAGKQLAMSEASRAWGGAKLHAKKRRKHHSQYSLFGRHHHMRYGRGR